MARRVLILRLMAMGTKIKSLFWTEEVYRPIIDSLAKHLRELEVRGKHDAQRAAQLDVFPEQFAIILQKLGTPQTDFDDVVTDMKLLLEQTDDTVSLAEELRAN